MYVFDTQFKENLNISKSGFNQTEINIKIYKNLVAKWLAKH